MTWSFTYEVFPNVNVTLVKFIYSGKATKLYKISTVDLTGSRYDKAKVVILQKKICILKKPKL